MRQTRKRGTVNEVVIPPPPPPPGGETLTINTNITVMKNIYQPGVHLVNDEFTITPDTNAVARLGECAQWACMETQYFGATGLWDTSANPPDPLAPTGTAPWTHLDNWIGRCRRAGLPDDHIMLSFLAPYWMIPSGVDGQPGWDAVKISFPALSNFGNMVDLIGWIVQRYGAINYLMWNEWKGLVGGSLPRSADMTSLYNQAWTRIKQVNPSAKFGGPYLGFRADSAWKGSVANNNQILWDLDASIDGKAGNVDSRRLDAVNYWLAHALGYDFFALDSANVHGTEIIRWLKGRGVTKPIYWAEFYPGAGIDVTGLTTTNARLKQTAQQVENMRRMAVAGGAATFAWGAEEGSGGDPVPAAPANAYWKEDATATMLPAGLYAKYFRQYFPVNTDLKQVTTTNHWVSGLASATKLMIINRLDTSQDVNVIVNSGAPTVTTVPAWTVIVRDIP